MRLNHHPPLPMTLSINLQSLVTVDLVTSSHETRENSTRFYFFINKKKHRQSTRVGENEEWRHAKRCFFTVKKLRLPRVKWRLGMLKDSSMERKKGGDEEIRFIRAAASKQAASHTHSLLCACTWFFLSIFISFSLLQFATD